MKTVFPPSTSSCNILCSLSSVMMLSPAAVTVYLLKCWWTLPESTVHKHIMSWCMPLCDTLVKKSIEAWGYHQHSRPTDKTYMHQEQINTLNSSGFPCFYLAPSSVWPIGASCIAGRSQEAVWTQHQVHPSWHQPNSCSIWGIGHYPLRTLSRSLCNSHSASCWY